MSKKSFDNRLYMDLQSQKILNRVNQFGDKLYIEFVIAIGRKPDGEIFHEKIIIPETFLKMLESTNHELFVQLSDVNSVTAYIENCEPIKCDSQNNVLARKKNM